MDFTDITTDVDAKGRSSLLRSGGETKSESHESYLAGQMKELLSVLERRTGGTHSESKSKEWEGYSKKVIVSYFEKPICF